MKNNEQIKKNNEKSIKNNEQIVFVLIFIFVFISINNFFIGVINEKVFTCIY